MAYGGRKFAGNESLQERIRNFPNARNNYFQPSNVTQLMQNSFMPPRPFMFQRAPNFQLGNNPLQPPRFNQERLIARGNRNIGTNKQPPPVRNVQFNNTPSTSDKNNRNENMKRSHTPSTDTEERESNAKRQRSTNTDSDDSNTSGGKYSRLTEQAELFVDQHAQSNELLDKKLKLRSALLCMIRKKFPGVSLHLVGSSCNGFASDNSDADFCIMISHKRNVNQRHEARFYLKTVESLIRPIRSLKSMQFIPAKVPILKFKDTISGCECDINVNNAVGIRNTHLLRTYSKIDKRVIPMVMAVKSWGKAREINDASQGTLSSYSLVLMILHYMQSGCNPPVLPSLQQSYPEYFRVDSNVDELPMFEPANMIPCDSSNNKQSVGELLEGFFRYYAEFSWSTKIMSIRLGTTILKKNNREFKDKYISIEEPFEQSNTARAVHEMSRFVIIKKEFQRANQRLKERLSLEYIT